MLTIKAKIPKTPPLWGDHLLKSKMTDKTISNKEGIPRPIIVTVVIRSIPR
ncbi:hypothetical protein MU1_12200 [Paenibacillus glycanilyticus]|uniref:Uncharacterized protein n=1 Tax=Paenibacillus glycanilyticus TaxID=126569 RepID=A0ABQ6GBA2_9BACL|nr:hypothetical protein MU1_12200 [Paenibacillus glycanilyticus]